jgi:hypothetical protein
MKRRTYLLKMTALYLALGMWLALMVALVMHVSKS